MNERGFYFNGLDATKKHSDGPGLQWKPVYSVQGKGHSWPK